MLGRPASPRNSAHSDHPNAASTPIEIKVSIVAVAWRRFFHVVRWNGSAPHTTTGAAKVKDSHCQLSNWAIGTMASSSTGAVRTAEITRRRRRASVASSAPGEAAETGSAASPERAGRVAV